MEYVQLGRSGLKVSKICLGCMSFGEPARGANPWTLAEEQSKPLIKLALDQGINFFDTANIYSDGTSEEIVGRALKEMVKRDDVVIATKVCFAMRENPNAAGLSRKAIFNEVDASLKRLGTDYIDLYQIHRWDYTTPIEETLSALDEVVKSGKVRYLGASSMYAWQFAKALYTADLHGWTRFISMQNHLSLLNREEEREMLPFCREEGIGVMPWSPLARGKLTRDWNEGSHRQETDEAGKKMYDATDTGDRSVIESVARVAVRLGVPRAQVALAWVLQQSGITSPIIGASKPNHLLDAIAAMSVKLTKEDLNDLESQYIPHRVVGYQ